MKTVKRSIDAPTPRMITRRPGQPLSAESKRQLERLAAMPDSEIDLSDMPELPASAWKNAVRGKFYRPAKEPVTIRLDADVLAWLKKKADASGAGYQTVTNHFLRNLMMADLEEAKSAARR